MEFSIDVHTGLNGKITIEDYSREYDQYFSEDETNQEKGKYKYSESKTINVLTKVNSESESKIGDPIIHNHDQLKPDPLYPDNYIYDLEKVNFKVNKDGYYVIHHIVLPTKQWLENTYLTHENEDYRKSYESIYIIDNNDIFKVSVQQLSINKENHLNKITKVSNFNQIDFTEYIYNENLDIVKIKTSNETTSLFYDENGLLIKSEKFNGVDINDPNAFWTTVEYIYVDGKLTSYTVKEFKNWTLYQEACDITVYTLVYEENNIVEITSKGQYYDWGSWYNRPPTKYTYSYENGKLINETKSYYDKWAESGNGGSEEPDDDLFNPATPIVVATTTETTITLSWDEVEGATKYNIYTPSSFSHNIYGITETTYTFENLTTGTEYCFEVSAVSSTGESDVTSVCATVGEEPNYIVEYSIIYTYDENGNCVSATNSNGEITDYIYDVTKLATDVYSFAYPYEVKPTNTNIIAKSETYRYESNDYYWDEEKQEWVETEPVKSNVIEATYHYTFVTNSNPNYIKNDKLLCKLEPVSIEELYKRNTEGTTIEKCTIDIFYTGYLQHCYINYCNKLFSKLTKNCNDLCIREDHKELIYIRDFLWMVLNIIDYQISFKNYMEAQRLLEITNYCGNFCQNQELHAGPNIGCRCSKN